MSAAPTPERPTRGDDGVSPITPAFEDRRDQARRDFARDSEEGSVQSAASHMSVQAREAAKRRLANERLALDAKRRRAEADHDLELGT